MKETIVEMCRYILIVVIFFVWKT